MKLDVILSAYNNPIVLSKVLDGYLLQTDLDFNLIIADDGSADDILKVCEAYKEKGLRMFHVWHEDLGFRRAEILNKAIALSEADYIVLSDSDCIPHKKFVADHKYYAEKNRMVIGRRIDLKLGITGKIMAGNESVNFVNNSFKVLCYGILGRLKRAEFGFYFPEQVFNLINKKKRKALGANMGVWREDLLNVNGFDNDFVGYGVEEVDLEWRLNEIGIENKSVIGRAILAHLYHVERKIDNNKNFELFESRKLTGEYKVRNGILNYDNE